jgi:hypothetical protein
MMEGLLRDRFMAERAGYPADYALADVPRILEAVLRCLLSGAE